MIRNALFLALATATTLATVATTALAEAGASSSQRRFEVHGFDAVDLRSSDTLRVLPGDAYAVTATGDPAAVNSLAIAVEGGTLRIDRTQGEHRDHGAVVTVALPTLRSLTLSGSGDVAASGWRVPTLITRLSGSGQMRLEQVHASELAVALPGSGTVTLDGTADRVGITLSGSGRIAAAALHTSMLRLDLSGSGQVAASASRAASIRAGGSGDVRIDGHPVCTVERSGAARVTCG